jgi:hypothetical protein
MGDDNGELAYVCLVTGTSAGDWPQQQFLTQSAVAKVTQVAFPARRA